MFTVLSLTELINFRISDAATMKSETWDAGLGMQALLATTSDLVDEIGDVLAKGHVYLKKAQSCGSQTWDAGLGMQALIATASDLVDEIGDVLANGHVYLKKAQFSTCGFLMMVVSVSSAAKFEELFQPSWAQDHFEYDGELLKLRLDNYSGAGFGSKSKYMFGKVTGDSAGTVTAFYMSSDGPAHNEFGFEFLGNTSGEPYVVQTNVYVNGVGNREPPAEPPAHVGAR